MFALHPAPELKIAGDVGIPKIFPEELRQAESLLTTMERTTDQSVWVDLNRQFHNLLGQVIDKSH